MGPKSATRITFFMECSYLESEHMTMVLKPYTITKEKKKIDFHINILYNNNNMISLFLFLYSVVILSRRAHNVIYFAFYFEIKICWDKIRIFECIENAFRVLLTIKVIEYFEKPMQCYHMGLNKNLPWNKFYEIYKLSVDFVIIYITWLINIRAVVIILSLHWLNIS